MPKWVFWGWVFIVFEPCFTEVYDFEPCFTEKWTKNDFTNFYLVLRLKWRVFTKFMLKNENNPVWLLDPVQASRQPGLHPELEHIFSLHSHPLNVCFSCSAFDFFAGRHFFFSSLLNCLCGLSPKQSGWVPFPIPFVLFCSLPWGQGKLGLVWQ